METPSIQCKHSGEPIDAILDTDNDCQNRKTSDSSARQQVVTRWSPRWLYLRSRSSIACLAFSSHGGFGRPYGPNSPNPFRETFTVQHKIPQLDAIRGLGSCS
jgi:hypothetical protein